MTDTDEPGEDPSLEAPQLEDLLLDLEKEPAVLVEELRCDREARMGDGSLARDLDRAELRFLEGKARDSRYGDLYRRKVDGARHARNRRDLRALRATPDDSVMALFDLAELRAAYILEEMPEEVDAVQDEITGRLEVVTEISEPLRVEARERYAALSTEEEDLDLHHKVLLLQQTQSVFDELARRCKDREMKRLAKRLWRASNDRILAMRLERLLTRRGATTLENTSLGLLGVIFITLGIVMALPEGHWLVTPMMVVDSSICLFFIVEFILKLSLAPARVSWFLRNVVTDLLPAIPAAMYFVVPGAPGGQATTAVRFMRVLRIGAFARYVQVLRPFLRLYRLVLFMIRSMDALVQRFSPLLNRNFIFFEREVLKRSRDGVDERALMFQAQRREHVILADLPVEESRAMFELRADRLTARHAQASIPEFVQEASDALAERDVPVEHAIEFLHRLRPEELGMWLPRYDVLAIDRVVRVINAPVIRSLPVIRWFRSPERLGSPGERVADFGRRIANLLERWRERILHVADMHGIVTGPQILDRIASAMVKASFRPARNLLVFGALFMVVRLVVGTKNPVGEFLEKFVGTPLIVLGSVCLVFFLVGRWMLAIAGEASDKFKLTSEAHFIGLLELAKRRTQDCDLEFLGKRIFRWDMDPWEAGALLANDLRLSRTGREPPGLVAPAGLEDEIYRVSLLYLHFLDGAILHKNDVKTTEQLLANLSLENIRNLHLGFSRKENKRLRRLSLSDGSMFKGPFVWFQFITESVAVEAAKRITDYNRHCLTLSQRKVATPAQRMSFAHWLRKRRRSESGRMEKTVAPGRGRYLTTEFNALDFLTVDDQREEHIEKLFGRHVLGILQHDRECMIREIFGTQPLHHMPRSKRTLNFYQFYQSRLSNGRVFLSPFYGIFMTLRGAKMGVNKTATIIREILAPDLAAQNRERGRASFAVALRKIHRMKAPTLIELMYLRVCFDPAYCGAPPGWSGLRGFEDVSELERDMNFLLLHERDREDLRRTAERNRRRVEELHYLVKRSPEFLDPELLHADDPELRRRGERAVTIAYMTNRNDLRTLFRAEHWFEKAVVMMEDSSTQLPNRFLRRSIMWTLRGFRLHPVRRWLDTHSPDRRVSRRGRGNFKRAWYSGDKDLKETVRAWVELDPNVTPRQVSVELAHDFYARRDDISRELAALRAGQSLSVLGVRNYRCLIFDLGGYAKDGEDRAIAEELP